MADLVLIGAGVVGLGTALSTPAVVERITDLAGDWQAEPVPAPGRNELVAIENS
jgi:hypothetical protein